MKLATTFLGIALAVPWLQAAPIPGQKSVGKPPRHPGRIPDLPVKLVDKPAPLPPFKLIPVDHPLARKFSAQIMSEKSRLRADMQELIRLQRVQPTELKKIEEVKKQIERDYLNHLVTSRSLEQEAWMKSRTAYVGQHGRKSGGWGLKPWDYRQFLKQEEEKQTAQAQLEDLKRKERQLQKQRDTELRQSLAKSFQTSTPKKVHEGSAGGLAIGSEGKDLIEDPKSLSKGPLDLDVVKAKDLNFVHGNMEKVIDLGEAFYKGLRR